jgi:hypothetical protein
MNMFEPRRTTEDLFAVPTDASHADKLNVHKDVLIRKGTIVWDCDVQADRWVITVKYEGQRQQFVSFRNPFGVTRGERLGAKFALHESVKIKKLHPLLAGRHGKVIGYGAKVDTYQVAVGPLLAVIAGEFLSPSKVTRGGS